MVLGNGNDLVDGIADGDGFEVMGAVVLDELQQGVAVADLDLGGRLSGLRVQFDVSGHGLGAFVSEDLDENVAVFTTVEGRGAEAEILGCSGQSPTSGKQLVRLFHSVSLEVFEVSLHQLLQIVRQINLQKKKWRENFIPLFHQFAMHFVRMPIFVKEYEIRLGLIIA